MRDIHQKVGAGADGGSPHSVRPVNPLKEASPTTSLQQGRRTPQLMDSDQDELLLQLEEERLQVCVCVLVMVSWRNGKITSISEFSATDCFVPDPVHRPPFYMPPPIKRRVVDRVGYETSYRPHQITIYAALKP